MTPEMTARKGGATARDLFVDWANSQDGWVRALAGEILGSRKALTPAVLDQVYEALLIEKELSSGDSLPWPVLSKGADAGTLEEPLLLVRLRQVENVNALAKGQEIAFNPRLTLLYGENATGKTGYARVLKALAGLRDAEPILGDVSAPLTKPPSARIEFRLGDTPLPELHWTGQPGISPLNRMDVFDSRGLLQHVDGEITYVYTPGDLALFRMASQAIDAIKGLLETARKAKAPQTNPFLLRFRETFLYAKIEALGPSTDIGELEALARVTPSDEAQLKADKETVLALEASITPTTLARYREEASLFSRVLQVGRVVSGLDSVQYSKVLAALQEARAQHRALGEESLFKLDVPGVLGAEWTSMVMSSQAYAATHQHEAGKSVCPLCRQALAEPARKLLDSYRKFTTDKSSTRAGELEVEARSHVSALVDIDVNHILEDIKQREASFDAGRAPELVRRAAGWLTAVAQLRDQLDALSTEAFSKADLSGTDALVADLQKSLDDMNGLIKSLTAERSERQARLVEERKKVRMLEARITLREAIDQIRTHVEGAKWADRANSVGKRFPVILKSLTEASKLASEEVLNHDFEKFFQKECEALQVPRLQLDFPGRRGEPARRKSISPKYKLSETLSEGEQKVVALADCLAEASLRRAASPLVFDDPVNSLDYKRLGYVVRRLVALSKERQVIVFTHNIWFTMELLALFDDNRADCAYFEVSRDGSELGLVVPGNSPRLDGWNDRKTRLNELISRAEKAQDRLEKEVFVEKGYGDLRGICEIVVEQDLLKRVVQSYAPNVMIGKLADIKVSLLPEAIATVNEVFEKCCRITGAHKQPLETLNVRPELADLKQDWKRIQDLRSKLTK